MVDLTAVIRAATQRKDRSITDRTTVFYRPFMVSDLRHRVPDREAGPRHELCNRRQRGHDGVHVQSGPQEMFSIGSLGM